MKILGPDFFIFAADDLGACTKCLDDYGLIQVERGSNGAIYTAQDGTGIMVFKPSDGRLPAPIAADPNIREVRYGVADKATLEAIGAELSKDREVKSLPGGILRSTDEDGYPISFHISVRRPIDPPHHGANVPGRPAGRPLNDAAADDSERPTACSLSHVVAFTADKVRATRFYTERLGFRVTDEFTDLGPFMRPGGSDEHHTMFLIQTPGAPAAGLQHFTFHFATVSEYLKAGWHFADKGYRSAWGPGRHVFGSNYFWYFNSPFGGLIEFDADMDRHDDSWKPRRLPASEDTTQTFLLQYAKKWLPGGPH
jgi:catechol 2,3-dioxygenase-like lactoylglutathione lyase family enzyme